MDVIQTLGTGCASKPLILISENEEYNTVLVGTFRCRTCGIGAWGWPHIQIKSATTEILAPSWKVCVFHRDGTGPQGTTWPQGTLGKPVFPWMF